LVEPSNRPRKALLDKTPGAHLQNRGGGIKLNVQTGSGKQLVLLTEKPPSASRKSVKQPRKSSDLQVPAPEIGKNQQHVGEKELTEQVSQLNIVEEDDDEVEYMPPPVQRKWIQSHEPRLLTCLVLALPIELEYDLPSGKEMGEKIMEIVTTPLHWYDDPPPISYDGEAFLYPEEYLVIPLGELRKLNAIYTHTLLTDPSSFKAPERLPFDIEGLTSDSDSDHETIITPAPSLTPLPTPTEPTGRMTRLQARKLRDEAASSAAEPSTSSGASSRATTSRVPDTNVSASSSSDNPPVRSKSYRSASRTTALSNSPLVASDMATAPAGSGTAKGKGQRGRAEQDPTSLVVQRPHKLKMVPELRVFLDEHEPMFDDFRFELDDEKL
jgi:hypothetical protein